MIRDSELDDICMYNFFGSFCSTVTKLGSWIDFYKWFQQRKVGNLDI